MLSLWNGMRPGMRPAPLAGLLRPATSPCGPSCLNAARISATQINNDKLIFEQNKQYFLSRNGSSEIDHSMYIQHALLNYKQVRSFATTAKMNDVNDVTPKDARDLGKPNMQPKQDPTNRQDFSTTREQENQRMLEEAITAGHSGKYAFFDAPPTSHRRYRIMGGLSIVLFISLMHPLVSWNIVRAYRAYKVRGEDGEMENHGGEWLRASYDRGSENWKPMSQIQDEVAARYKSASKFRVLKYIKTGSDNDISRRKTGQYPQHGKPSQPNLKIGKFS